VIQNFDSYKTATTIEKLTFDNPKTMPTQRGQDDKGNALPNPSRPRRRRCRWSVASQESIKELAPMAEDSQRELLSPYRKPDHAVNVLEIAASSHPVRAHLHIRQDGGDTPGWALMIAMLVFFAHCDTPL